VDNGEVRGGQPHYHIEAHVYMGIGVVFEEGVDKVGRLPSSIMGCGRSRSLK
jgi:hypothetical protein